MARRGHARLRRLDDAVAHAYPDFEDPGPTIRARRVSVDGRVVDNPASLVRLDARIAIVREAELRGEAKLTPALERFDVSVDGRVASTSARRRAGSRGCCFERAR